MPPNYTNMLMPISEICNNFLRISIPKSIFWYVPPFDFVYLLLEEKLPCLNAKILQSFHQRYPPLFAFLWSLQIRLILVLFCWEIVFARKSSSRKLWVWLKLSTRRESQRVSPRNRMFPTSKFNFKKYKDFEILPK